MRTSRSFLRQFRGRWVFRRSLVTGHSEMGLLSYKRSKKTGHFNAARAPILKGETKVKMSGSSNERTIFVFFEPINKAQWTYPRIGMSAPYWWYAGGGSTGHHAYPRENQFQGPRASRSFAVAYLKRKFLLLVRKGLVTRFAITDSYEDLSSL
jgi:hypothetical protein